MATKERKERDDEFKFEIVRHLGVVSRAQTGWTKEINLVSWRGGTPKVDIREWDPDHERMSRGLTMKKDEAIKTLLILTKFYQETGDLPGPEETVEEDSSDLEEIA